MKVLLSEKKDKVRDIARDIIGSRRKRSVKYEDIEKELIYLYLAYRVVSDRGDIVYISSRKVTRFYDLVCGISVRFNSNMLLNALRDLGLKDIEIISSIKEGENRRKVTSRYRFIIKRRELAKKSKVRRYVSLLCSG